MKRYLCLLIMLLMCFCFSACGSGQEDNTAVWEFDADAKAATLPNEVQDAFDNATKDYDKGELKPVAYYSKQIVSGVNYQILCENSPKEGALEPGLQVLVIYQDLKGNAEVTKTTDFYVFDYYRGEFTDADEGGQADETKVGAWEVPEDYTRVQIPDDAKAAYEEATGEFTDAGMTPMVCLGSRNLSETEYAFLCHHEKTDDEEESIQVVFICADKDGNYGIRSICTLDPAAYN